MLAHQFGLLEALAFIGVLAGAGVRVLKWLWPTAPSVVLPLTALVLSYALMLGDQLLGGTQLEHAWRVAIYGVFSAGFAVLGHEALKKIAVTTLARFIGEDNATRIVELALGKLVDLGESPPPAPAKRGATMLVIAMSLGPIGCAGLLPALAAVAQTAQHMGSVLDVADAGQAAYFARHPNVEAQAEVLRELQRTRLALASLDAAARAAKSADAGDLKAAKAHAVEAYRTLRELLYSLGVPQALPSPGGADGEAPDPVPFELPKAEAFDS